MTGHRFQDIWKEQCEAARGVREQHGVVSALDYLIGEKLMTYAETAVGRPEFAHELPRFVAEIRSIFYNRMYSVRVFYSCLVEPRAERKRPNRAIHNGVAPLNRSALAGGLACRWTSRVRRPSDRSSADGQRILPQGSHDVPAA